jgi:hypothetical protein
VDLVKQQQDMLVEIDLFDWHGKGLYFVKILDPKGVLQDLRKGISGNKKPDPLMHHG